MDMKTCTEFWNVKFVNFKIFTLVLVGNGAVKGKDNELAAFGNSDETWCKF